MSFNSPSDNHETKHDPNHPAGTTKSQETGGNLQRVPANRAACETIARALPYRESDYIGEVEFIGLREISYARACRSRAAVLCASTDAEDAIACAVCAARKAVYQARPFAGLRPIEAFNAAKVIYRRRYRRTEDPS